MKKKYPGKETGKNIIIIGMPGAGKSTIGLRLAKILGMNFIDTDIVIEETSGRSLQDILDKDGIDAFLAIEESTILSLNCTTSVIATGGSVVLSGKSMEHLKRSGRVIYLSLGFDEMVQRLKNITTRGIVLPEGQSLSDLYHQRIPLYERYADLTIDCSEGDSESIIRKVIHEL